MKNARDFDLCVDAKLLKNKKNCGSTDKNKRYICIVCGFDNCGFINSYTKANGTYVSSHFKHFNFNINSNNFCLYYTPQSKDSEVEKKEILPIKSNLKYFLENWYEYISEEWNEHIMSYFLPSMFVYKTYKPIENENRYIYFINQELQEERLHKTLSKHTTTDNIIFIFNLNERRTKYNFYHIKDKVYINFNQKLELPFFVNYDHNYRNIPEPKPKFPNVCVFLDINADCLLKVNFFEDYNRSFEVLPISIQKLRNDKDVFKGIINFLPERNENDVITKLKANRDKYIKQSLNFKQCKMCFCCNKPFIKEVKFSNCDKCRQNWGYKQKMIKKQTDQIEKILFIDDE